MTKLRGNPWAILAVAPLGFFPTLLEVTVPGASTFDRRDRSPLGMCWIGKEKL